MINCKMDNYVQNGLSKWYFYSDIESTIIDKLEYIQYESIDANNTENCITIEFVGGQDLMDYLYDHKGIKLFVKREYKCINLSSGQKETFIEKFSSVDFNISNSSDTEHLIYKTININAVQILGRRKSEVKEIYEFW